MCWFNLKFSKEWYIKVTYTMTSSFIEVKVAANCKLFLAFYNIISFTNKRFNLKFLPNFAAMLQKLLPGHIPKQASST